MSKTLVRYGYTRATTRVIVMETEDVGMECAGDGERAEMQRVVVAPTNGGFYKITGWSPKWGICRREYATEKGIRELDALAAAQKTWVCHTKGGPPGPYGRWIEFC